jgi:hypothetical protein
LHGDFLAGHVLVNMDDRKSSTKPSLAETG